MWRPRLLAVVALASTAPFLLGPAGRSQTTSATNDDRAVTRSTPLITGVQLHFGAMIRKAGYQPGPTDTAMRTLDAVSARDNLSWPDLAQTQGSGIAARLPALFDVTHQRGAAAPPLLTPHGGLPNIDGGNLPTSPGALRAFSAFVGDAVTAWKGTGALVEIWNEWDKGVRKGDYGTPESYVALVKATAPAIRRGAPDAKILAGGAADDRGQLRSEWTKSMIDGGGLDSADALSIHLYDHCAAQLLPRATDEMMARLDDIHAYAAAHAPGKSDIYVSEFGWPSNSGRCGVDAQAVAENVAQFIFAASARPWIRGVWYYELKDSGRDPAEIEDNFGLLTYDYRPKPAFCAYQAAAKLVRSARPVRVVRDGSAMRVDFAGGDGTVSVIWLADRRRPMQFSTDAATAQPVCGAAAVTRPGWADLSARPIILRSGGAAPRIQFRSGPLSS
ncbi:MAG: hypothetical protein DI605_18310 [Sphingomonas sp.]|nr:MAG: hypothetical protein DI605_18310 [Sphingomonas sp.]